MKPSKEVLTTPELRPEQIIGYRANKTTVYNYIVTTPHREGVTNVETPRLVCHPVGQRYVIIALTWTPFCATCRIQLKINNHY